MKKKKVIKASLYTALVLTTISLANYPESYLKLYREEEGLVNYDAQLYKLYSNSTLKETEASYNYADFTFTFAPSANLPADYKKDVYEVVLPEGCYFGSSKSNGTEREKKYSYSLDSDKKMVSQKMYCTVDSINNNGQLELNVKIVEQLDEEPKYVYLDYFYSKSYTDYVSQIKEIGDNITIKETDGAKIYDELIKTIQGGKIDYKEEILYYLQYYRNGHPFTDLSDPEVLGELKQLIIEYINNKETSPKELIPGFILENKDGNYTFVMDENFIGYARTFEQYATIPPTAPTMLVMYFSTDNITASNTDLDKVFKTYLSEYVYTSTEDKENIDLILKYVNNEKNKGIYSVLNRTNKINGLTASVEDGVILLDSTILHYAKEIYSIPVSYKQSIDMLMDFALVATEKYAEFIDSASLQKLFMNEGMPGGPIFDSLTKNATDKTTTPEEYHDYFIYKDETNNQYLLIKIWSYGASEAFTYVLIENLVTTATIELTDKDETTYSVNITNIGELSLNDINSLVNTLSTFFGVDKSLFTINENIVTAEIPKKLSSQNEAVVDEGQGNKEEITTPSDEDSNGDTGELVLSNRLPRSTAATADIIEKTDPKNIVVDAIVPEEPREEDKDDNSNVKENEMVPEESSAIEDQEKTVEEQADETTTTERQLTRSNLNRITNE